MEKQGNTTNAGIKTFRYETFHLLLLRICSHESNHIIQGSELVASGQIAELGSQDNHDTTFVFRSLGYHLDLKGSIAAQVINYHLRSTVSLYIFLMLVVIVLALQLSLFLHAK